MEIGFSIVPANALEHLERMATRAPQGAFVEVGVYAGGSARVLHRVATEQERALYLYDTFVGLPYDLPEDNHRTGEFNANVTVEAIEKLCPGAFVHKGIFPKVPLPEEQVALLHLDCDQYQSYKDAIAAMHPIIRYRGMIVCDDYSLVGANRAIMEAVDQYGYLLIEHDHRATLIKC